MRLKRGDLVAMAKKSSIAGRTPGRVGRVESLSASGKTVKVDFGDESRLGTFRVPSLLHLGDRSTVIYICPQASGPGFQPGPGATGTISVTDSDFGVARVVFDADPSRHALLVPIRCLRSAEPLLRFEASI